MMYSNFVEINGTGPVFGDTPQVDRYPGAKNVKFLVRKSEGEIDGAGDDILIADAIAVDAVDPTATFYLNSYDLLNKTLEADDFTLDCVYCDLEIDSVTQVDNRSFDIQFSGDAFVTFPEITPDAVPGVETYPTITPNAVPAVAVENPTIVITSAVAFVSEALVEDTDNWTVEVGDTGLTLASIVYVDPNTANLVFTGTVAAGHLVIGCGAALFASGLRGLEIDCATATENYTTEAKYDIDYVIEITSDTAFVSEAAVENLSNWTITPGTTGLTLDSVEYVDANTANLNFSGVVASDNLIIQADKECYGGDLRSLSIDLDTGAETFSTESPAPAGTITLTLAKEAVMGASADLSIEYTMGDAASVVAFTETGLAGTLDTYIFHDDNYYHVKETTVDEDGNCLAVSDTSFNPNSKYSFKYTSTIENDTGKYFLMALYES